MIPFILTIVGGYLIGDSMNGSDEKPYNPLKLSDGGSVGDMKIKDVPKIDIYESDTFNSVDISVYHPAPNQNISTGLGRVFQDFDEAKKKFKKNSFTAEKFIADETNSKGEVTKFSRETIGTFKTRDEAKEALLNTNVDKKLLPSNIKKLEGEIASGPNYYDQNWTRLPYAEKVEKQQKLLSDAGVEVGDIVIKPEGRLTLYGTVTLLPESDPKDMKIGMMSYMSPMRIVFDNMTQKATGGSKYDYIDGYKLYLKKDIAQMFGPKKKKKMADGGPIDKAEIDIYKEDDERSYTGRSTIKVYYTKGDIGFDGRLKEYHTGIGWEMEFEPDYFDDKESENYYDENSDAIEEEILDYFYSNEWKKKKMADGGETDEEYKRRKEAFSFKPYGKTKGKFKITYIADGKKQSEIWESKEMALDTAKRYKKIEEFSNIEIFDENGKKIMADGGEIAESNNRMLMSKVKEVKHHAEELGKAVKPKTEVEGWVVAKAERSASDLSDITHYLDGLKK